MKFIKEVTEFGLTNEAIITYRRGHDEVKYYETYINIFRFQLGFTFCIFDK